GMEGRPTVQHTVYRFDARCEGARLPAEQHVRLHLPGRHKERPGPRDPDALAGEFVRCEACELGPDEQEAYIAVREHTECAADAARGARLTDRFARRYEMRAARGVMASVAVSA